MLRPRHGFDAVLLGDGKVLAVGDDYSCAPGGAMGDSDRAELYDPHADAWIEVESLNKLRKMPATAALPDGTAIVLGGLNDDDFPFSSTRIFSPSTRTWTPGPLLNLARSTPFVAALAGDRLLAVGNTGPGGSKVTTEILDPATASWAMAASLPATTDVHNIVGLADGRVLATGFDGRDSEPVSIAYVFDPGRDTWKKVDAPAQFQFDLVALPDGGALAIGGTNGGELEGGNGDVIATVSRFDATSGRWAHDAPMSTPRLGPQVVVLEDGRVLVAGGRTGSVDDDGHARTLRSTEIYDPRTGRWSPSGDMLKPRKNGLALTLADGTVAVLGGDDAYNTEGETPFCYDGFTTVELFDPGP